MQQVTEKELREAIRYVLEEKNNSLINEQTQSYTINISAQEFWDALIQPWIEVLKIAKLEAQKTLANLLTLFRVMTSFNRQKIQNIMDNHNDRMRDLNSQTEQLLSALPMSTDVAMGAFFLNPGAFIAAKANGGQGAVENVAEFFRGAGFGDYTPGELANPDRNGVARARKREQSGLISKALRGLNSLFMAGYNPGSNMILEQDEVEEDIPPFEERNFDEIELTADGINLIIDENGGLEDVEKVRKEMMVDAASFLKDTKNANKLVEILRELGGVKDLDSYMEVLGKLQQISPESGMPQRAEIEASLEADTKQIAAQEGSQEEAAKMVLINQGNKDPSEEELAAISDEEKMNQIRSVAFGNILVRLRQSAAESAAGIYETHKNAYDLLYPEDAAASEKKIIDESEYGNILNQAKNVLDAMQKSITTVGV